MTPHESDAERLWWERLRAKAAKARQDGANSFDLGELAFSAEGRLSLAFVAAINNWAAKERHHESIARQRFLLGRYTAYKAAGGRPADRSRQVEDTLDPALLALANRAAPWELSELTADLRGSRGVVERRIAEYYELGDKLLNDDPTLGEIRTGPPEGTGLPRRSWLPEPPTPEADNLHLEIVNETSLKVQR